MKTFYARYKEDFRFNWILAWPIMLSQLGQVTVNFIDTVMVGRLGGNSLAAIALANSLFFTFLVFGLGLSFALTPLVAEAIGAKNEGIIKEKFINSLYINLCFAVVAGSMIYFGSDIMYKMGQDPAVVPMAIEYAKIMAITMVPFMIFQTYRTLSEGLSRTKLIFLVTVLGNLVNVFFNYALIFGKFGFEAQGTKGAALGTLIARIFMMVAMILTFIYWEPVRKYLRGFVLTVRREVLGKIFNIGLPTALSGTFEVTAFAASAFLIGTYGSEQLAAHQIAINLASISFLICTGFSTASTIRVGNKFGEKDFKSLARVGYAFFTQVVIFMGIFAIIFIIGRNWLPHLYIDDPEIIRISSILILVAAIFQIVDGVQVVGMGVLRGMQDVWIPSLITFFSYWVVALPLGYFLSSRMPLNALGIWIGLAVGLALAAVLLFSRFQYFVRNKIDLS